jgi:hypothetical protein
MLEVLGQTRVGGVMKAAGSVSFQAPAEPDKSPARKG